MSEKYVCMYIYIYICIHLSLSTYLNLYIYIYIYFCFLVFLFFNLEREASPPADPTTAPMFQVAVNEVPPADFRTTYIIVSCSCC